MRDLRKTKRDRTRNQTTRMGLGIIPRIEMIELAQLRFLHNNAVTHAAVHTVETLCQLHSVVLECPPYSHDEAPLNHHHLDSLRDALNRPSICQ
jgi:hypothetical protein